MGSPLAPPLVPPPPPHAARYKAANVPAPNPIACLREYLFAVTSPPRVPSIGPQVVCTPIGVGCNTLLTAMSTDRIASQRKYSKAIRCLTQESTRSERKVSHVRDAPVEGESPRPFGATGSTAAHERRRRSGNAAPRRPPRPARRRRPTRRVAAPQGSWLLTMPYSMESTRASQLASMMFSLTPMLPQVSSPSLASSSTRVTAPVPLFSSRMRTL